MGDLRGLNWTRCRRSNRQRLPRSHAPLQRPAATSPIDGQLRYTLAPEPASAMARAAPTPEPPPVMTAIWPSNARTCSPQRAHGSAQAEVLSRNGPPEQKAMRLQIAASPGERFQKAILSVRQYRGANCRRRKDSAPRAWPYSQQQCSFHQRVCKAHACQVAAHISASCFSRPRRFR